MSYGAHISTLSFLLRSGKDAQKAELAAAEARGKADAEKNALQGAYDAAVGRAEAERASLQTAVWRLEQDAKEYKVPVCRCPESQLRCQHV